LPTHRRIIGKEAIDARTQERVYHALASFRSEQPADWLGALVIDPRSGRLLCCAVAPPPSPGPFRGSDRPEGDNPLLYALLEPGSTLKPLYIAAALDRGLVREDELIECDPGPHADTTWDPVPPGTRTQLSLEQILAYSSNAGALEVCARLGEDAALQYLIDFGFHPHDLHFPRVPASRVAPGFGLRPLSQGRSVACPPVTLLGAHASVVNGGYACTPFLVEGTPPRPRRQVVSSQTSQALRRMLLSVTEYGTARGIHNDDWPIIGKTGTVAREPRVPGRRRPVLSWFVGFAPPHDPTVGVLVVVQAPEDRNYWGGTVSATLGAKIFALLREQL